MKQFLPFILAGLGVAFIVISLILRHGTGDADTAITNLSSSFMLVAGTICLVGGIVTYFMADNPEVW